MNRFKAAWVAFFNPHYVEQGQGLWLVLQNFDYIEVVPKKAGTYDLTMTGKNFKTPEIKFSDN